MPDPTDKHIGRVVQSRREALDMSRKELADQLGIQARQVAAHERGSRRLSVSRLKAVADALDVHITFFVEHLPCKNPNPRITLEASEHAMIASMRNLPGDLRNHFHTLITTTAGGDFATIN